MLSFILPIQLILKSLFMRDSDLKQKIDVEM